jgi:hypothetical protein
MTATVAPGLTLGPAEEASKAREQGYHLVSVHEAPPDDAPKADAWVPILIDVQTEDGVEERASPRMLDEAADAIAKAIKRGKRVFLYCGSSSERSPLVAAWYLWRSGQATTFDAAYNVVLEKRPGTRRRDSWILWDEPG